VVADPIQQNSHAPFACNLLSRSIDLAKSSQKGERAHHEHRNGARARRVNDRPASAMLAQCAGRFLINFPDGCVKILPSASSLVLRRH
jgi:hypothetical protein